MHILVEKAYLFPPSPFSNTLFGPKMIRILARPMSILAHFCHTLFWIMKKLIKITNHNWKSKIYQKCGIRYYDLATLERVLKSTYLFTNS